MMGKGERGGEVRAGGGGGRCQSTKYISVIQCCSGENLFRATNFFVDDDSGLIAIGSVC
jgi:hypothetical protein